MVVILAISVFAAHTKNHHGSKFEFSNEHLLDALLEGSGVGDWGFKHNITAGKHGYDILKAQGLEGPFQPAILMTAFPPTLIPRRKATTTACFITL